MKFLIVALTVLVVTHAGLLNSNKNRPALFKAFFSKTREITASTLPNAEAAHVHGEIEKYVDNYYNKIGINYTQFDNALEETGDCLAKAYDDLALCDIVTQKLIECTNKPISILESSMSDQRLKGTPTLVIKAIHSVAEFICNAKGKQLIELVNPCVVDNGEQIATCFKSTVDDLGDETKTVNIRDTVCSDTKKSKTCWEKIVNEKCRHDFTKKSVTSFLDAVTVTPCSG